MKYFGEGGLITKLEKKIDHIIDLYVKAFNQEGSPEYNIFHSETCIYVGFEKSYCGCCPAENIGGFYITEAMLNRPKFEIDKLVALAEKERKKKEAEIKAKEAKRKKEKIAEEKETLRKLKEKYESGEDND